MPFMVDVPIKGPPSCYETNNKGWYLPSPMGYMPDDNQQLPVPHASDLNGIFYEVIEENPGIRRFVWEHLENVNRVMQCIKKCSGTFSGWKMDICVPSIVVVGHRCTYKGCILEDCKIKKILDWPACNSLTEVHGFLGVCSVVRIWVKDFSKKVCPLVELTKKIMDFVWEEPQELAMAELKDAVSKAPWLRPIDYLSLLAVILTMDSSYITLGFVIYQMGADKERYPNQFGSITWNDRESRYLQAKLEIYRPWRALCAVWLHIIGVKNLVVEVDAQYIKGMLNNPNAAQRRCQQMDRQH
jgi:hypothetical protein